MLSENETFSLSTDECKTSAKFLAALELSPDKPITDALQICGDYRGGTYELQSLVAPAARGSYRQVVAAELAQLTVPRGTAQSLGVRYCDAAAERALTGAEISLVHDDADPAHPFRPLPAARFSMGLVPSCVAAEGVDAGTPEPVSAGAGGRAGTGGAGGATGSARATCVFTVDLNDGHVCQVKVEL